MITKLSDPAYGFEIWRRLLEEWEPDHRGRYRAMLMQLLQFPFTGDRSGLGGVGTTRAAVRGTELRHTSGHDQSSNTGTHNPQDPEWRRHVMHQAYRQWSMADGNEATPMEVDVLTKVKAKRKAEQRARTRRRKERQTSRI